MANKMSAEEILVIALENYIDKNSPNVKTMMNTLSALVRQMILNEDVILDVDWKLIKANKYKKKK